MPTAKPGKKLYQVVLDEESEAHITLLEWAKKRGLTPGRALRVITVDWSDAMNGRPNPFAAAIAAAGGAAHIVATPSNTLSTIEPTMSAEEQARQAALLQAAAQFL